MLNVKGKKQGSRGRRSTFKEEGRGRRNSMRWGVWSLYPQEWCCSILLRLSVVLNALFILLCSCVTGRLRRTPVSQQIQTQALCRGAIRQALNLHKCLALAQQSIYSKSFKLLFIHIPHSPPIYHHTYRVISSLTCKPGRKTINLCNKGALTEQYWKKCWSVIWQIHTILDPKDRDAKYVFLAIIYHSKMNNLLRIITKQDIFTAWAGFLLENVSKCALVRLRVHIR